MIPGNSVFERYERDAHFRQLVDTIWMLIDRAQYTPTEIREAAILAQIKAEQYRIRPWIIPLRPLDGQL